jgi:nucleotide-binding universal stress UspA family protein
MIWPRRAAQRTATPGGVALAVPRPILVGVDGSAASTRALEWATVRAYAGHTSLHIVHVVRAHVWLDPRGLTACLAIEPRELAQQVLDEATLCARYYAPQLQISSKLCGTDPAAALLDEGRTAELIVLGRRSHGRRGTGWLTPSRSSPLVQPAPSPASTETLPAGLERLTRPRRTLTPPAPGNTAAATPSATPAPPWLGPTRAAPRQPAPTSPPKSEDDGSPPTPAP